MNKKSLTLILISLIMLSLFMFSSIPSAKAYVNGTNLLADPGFESGAWDSDGIGGWKMALGGTFSSANHYSGALSLTAANGGAGSTYEQTLLYPILGANIQEFSFYSLAQVNNTWSFTLGITYNDTTTSSTRVGDVQNIWVLRDYTSLIDDAKFIQKITISPDYGHAPGTATWIDDILLEPNFPYVTLEAENIDSGSQWVYTNWRYYTFTVHVQEFWGTLTEAAIAFNVSIGGNAEVATGYDSDSVDWVHATSLTDDELTRFGDPTQMKAGTWTFDSVAGYHVTFGVWFNEQCLDVWEEPIDISMYLNFSDRAEWDWHVAGASDQFYIYSKGGFSMNAQSTNPATANKIVGEEWAALYCSEGETVSNEIWFRDLQHVKMLPEIQFDATKEVFHVNTYVEFSTGNGEWLPGWKSIITVSYCSYTGIFAGNVWINMTVNWYQGTGTPGDYAFVKSDDIYMFYRGLVGLNGGTGKWRLWNDQWFNNINASTTGGGRINAYEYPMQDYAAPWYRWLSNSWGVKDDVAKETAYMADLIGSNGTAISSESISMVKVRVELDVESADAGQYVVMNNYGSMDYTRSPNFPLTGVQTPVFDETKMPIVGNTGLLGAIFSMFSGIGQWLSENIIFGGLNLWGTFVNFLDTIAGWLGAPGFFSGLFASIGNYLSYFVSGGVYALTIVYDFFLLIAALMGTFLTTIGQLITSLLATLTSFSSIMSGAVGGAGNLWTTFNISAWLTLAIIFYPIYLVVLWENSGMDAVMSQLTMIFGIMVWLFGFFYQIITFLISSISNLIESIPVAE